MLYADHTFSYIYPILELLEPPASTSSQEALLAGPNQGVGDLLLSGLGQVAVGAAGPAALAAAAAAVAGQQPARRPVSVEIGIGTPAATPRT